MAARTGQNVTVSRVHDVLRWSNRTLVAQEITRRGFRVSKETLNRWLRQEKEVPAAVERIVFEMFGIGQQEAAPPEWAERLLVGVMALESANGVTPEQIVAAQQAAELALEVDTRLAAELTRPQRRSSEPSAGPSGAPGAELPGSKRQKP